MRASIVIFVAGLLAASPAMAAPAAGDTFVYRVLNGYNKEVRGHVTYRVDKVEGGQLTLAVTPEPASLGLPYTETLTTDGNWVRHPLINHDQPVEYDFSPPYPAYSQPLSAGNSWSTRVNAMRAADGRRASVRVDAEIAGADRISTPAGAFDVVRVKRRIYAGDWEPFKNETNIEETEWFAPALGRPISLDRKSGYIDQQRCAQRGACTPTRGDWLIYELVSYSGKS